MLTRQELASQVQRYVETFHLNMINSAKIQYTQYDEATERWNIHFQTPAGQRTAVARQLILATGIGAQKPNIPIIPDRDIYKGISVHSAEYKNANKLKEDGAKVRSLVNFF